MRGCRWVPSLEGAKTAQVDATLAACAHACRVAAVDTKTAQPSGGGWSGRSSSGGSGGSSGGLSLSSASPSRTAAASKAPNRTGWVAVSLQLDACQCYADCALREGERSGGNVFRLRTTWTETATTWYAAPIAART